VAFEAILPQEKAYLDGASDDSYIYLFIFGYNATADLILKKEFYNLGIFMSFASLVRNYIWSN